MNQSRVARNCVHYRDSRVCNVPGQHRFLMPGNEILQDKKTRNGSDVHLDGIVHLQKAKVKFLFPCKMASRGRGQLVGKTHCRCKRSKYRQALDATES